MGQRNVGQPLLLLPLPCPSPKPSTHMVVTSPLSAQLLQHVQHLAFLCPSPYSLKHSIHAGAHAAHATPSRTWLTSPLSASCFSRFSTLPPSASRSNAVSRLLRDRADREQRR